MSHETLNIVPLRRGVFRTSALALLTVLAGCGTGPNGEDNASERVDDAAFSLENCTPGGGSQPCYSQVPIEVGAGWREELVSGVAVEDNGEPYSEPIYFVDGVAGIDQSPLPSEIKADLIDTSTVPDPVYSVSRHIVDEIVLSEQLGYLTPALVAIAEDLDEPELEPMAVQGLHAGSLEPQKAWFGSCSSQYQSRSLNISKTISLVSNHNINGNFGGTLSTGGSATANVAISVQTELKRFKFFNKCIPYALRLDWAKAQGSVDMNPSASLNGNVTASHTWEKELSNATLGSLDFKVASIPIRIALSLPLSVGLELSGSASGNISYSAWQTTSGTFNYTCTLNGCTGTSNFDFSGSTLPTSSANLQGRIEPSVWFQAGFRASFYADSVSYAQIAVRPYVRGDFWEYHGNGCGDADGNGTNEQVDARTFDLDWQVHLTAQAAAFGKTPTKWNDLWHTNRMHIGFWNLLNTSSMQPIFRGPTAPVVGVAQPYTAMMRSCWPYLDSVNYKLTCSDNSTQTKTGAPKTTTTINKTFSAPGSYSLDLTAQSDVHGRILGGVTNRSAQATDLAPPSSTRTLWLRADAGVTISNGKVTNWDDQDDSNNDAYMATVERQPSLITNAINGNPVIRFYGTQSLRLTNTLSHSNFTVFVAGKNSHPSSFSMILGPTGTGTNGNNQLRWENGTQALLVGLGNDMPIVTATVGNTKVYHALSARYDGSQLKLYRDGNLVSTSSFVTSGPWELNQIGAWVSQYFMVGDLAELLFYSSALSESNRSTANSYLKTKYALP
jgi:hypothetical protein